MNQCKQKKGFITHHHRSALFLLQIPFTPVWSEILDLMILLLHLFAQVLFVY